MVKVCFEPEAGNSSNYLLRRLVRRSTDPKLTSEERDLAATLAADDAKAQVAEDGGIGGAKRSRISLILISHHYTRQSGRVADRRRLEVGPDARR